MITTIQTLMNQTLINQTLTNKAFSNIAPIKLFIVSLIVISLTSCSSIDIKQYQSNKPAFDIANFFNGPLTAHGIVKNRSGKVTRYFNATIAASWDDNGVGTLDEVFNFDDGEIQKRIWTLVPNGDGSYTATANDVKGSSVTQEAGNALFMNYKLEVNVNGRTIVVNIDDKMYRVNDSTVINESIIKKFGIRFGSVTITIVKA